MERPTYPQSREQLIISKQRKKMALEPALSGLTGIPWKLGRFFQAAGKAYTKVLSPKEEPDGP